MPLAKTFVTLQSRSQLKKGIDRMRGTIDRLEGDYYIVELENEEMIQVEKGSIRLNEGDVVEVKGNEIVKVLEEETKKRKASIEALMKDLFND